MLWCRGSRGGCFGVMSEVLGGGVGGSGWWCGVGGAGWWCGVTGAGVVV